MKKSIIPFSMFPSNPATQNIFLAPMVRLAAGFLIYLECKFSKKEDSQSYFCIGHRYVMLAIPLSAAGYDCQWPLAEVEEMCRRMNRGGLGEGGEFTILVCLL